MHIITILHDEPEKNVLGGTGGGAKSLGRPKKIELVMYAWFAKKKLKSEIENVERSGVRRTLMQERLREVYG